MLALLQTPWLTPALVRVTGCAALLAPCAACVATRPARYDLSPESELARALRINPRVELMGQNMLAYKSEHGISNKEDLLAWLRGHPRGTRLPRIIDAYK
jgi:hypothetical protein